MVYSYLLLFRFFTIHEREGKFPAHGNFAIIFADRLDEVERAHRADMLAGEFHGVAGADGVFKFHVVHTGVEGGFALHRIRHQHTGGLRRHLAKDHTRDDRVVGEMPLQEKFVAADGVLARRGAVFVFIRLVQKEHGLTVGEDLFNLFSIHRGILLYNTREAAFFKTVSASETISSIISLQVCSFVTIPAIWPQRKEPFSQSPC